MSSPSPDIFAAESPSWAQRSPSPPTPTRPLSSSTTSPSPPASAVSKLYSLPPTTCAPPTPPSQTLPKTLHELPPPRARPPPQGPPSGVALPRFHQRDALLRAPGGRRLRSRLRPHQLPHHDPPDLWRHSLGRPPLRLNYRPESVLGPRAAQPGPRSPTDGPLPRLRALPRQSPRKHALRPRRRSDPGPHFHRLLQPPRPRQHLAPRPHPPAWHLGSGCQRNLLCRPRPARAQPRTPPPTATSPYLAASPSRDGSGHYRGPHVRPRSYPDLDMDQAVGGLRHHLYHHLHSALRNRAQR